MLSGTRLTESFIADRPPGSALTWLTMKWTGSANRDADLHDGMLTPIKVVAEST
jgi:hypothetical protein